MEIEINNDLTAEEYNNLRESIGWKAKDNELVENAIKNSIIIKKVKLDNKVVGMARVVGDGMYYLIVDVLVDERYQRKGIGKKIINEIIEEIENRTKEGQTCIINLISMEGKEDFYEKCGFIKVPFDNTGYGMIRKIEK